MATDNVDFYSGNPGYLDHTPSSAVAAGEVVVEGEIPLIAHKAIAANEKGAVARGGGVYIGDKTAGSGTAVTKGTLLYWDASGSKPTTTAGSNKVLGYCAADAADADTRIYFVHEPNAAATG